MRTFNIACLALIVSGLLPGAGVAQTKGQVQIDGIIVGFPTDATNGSSKSGAWTPVYVDLTAGPLGLSKAELTVETDDSDDVRSRYTIAVPPLDPKEQVRVVSYIRPGSSSAEVVATVTSDGRPLANPYKVTAGSINTDEQLFLTIGSRLPSLNKTFNPTKDGEDSSKGTTLPARALTVVDDVRMLPNRWFAYEPVDAVIIATGNRDFVTALVNEREDRKKALAEWVRRGGKLIISLGKNQDMLTNLEPIQSLLPVVSTGTLQFPRLKMVELYAGAVQRPFENLRSRTGDTRPPVEIAKLERKPGREVDVLLPQGSQQGPLLLVQGAYGLGRVTVVAFDLDAPPFTTWDPNAQTQFWENLLKDIGAPKPREVANQNRIGFGGYDNQNSDLATRLETNLEDFEDVPVISFGWVALFILIYILVVGPLDYFFLKKVVKRLELTWITFPTVVITISVVAYFTAYSLKGNDQKINKIDLVDIDLQTQQVYGNTWFTIFSPRIQHYKIGLEPATPTWVAAPAPGKQDSSVTLSWMGRPELGFGGTGRTSSPGLFRRAYDYAPDAMGLLGVPIQVWSTKSFSATWRAGIDPAKPPIVGDLRHPKEKPEAISGTIKSELPIELDDVALYYGRGGAGRWYSIGRLVPDVPQRVDNIFADGSQAKDMNAWFLSSPSGTQRKSSPAPNRYNQTTTNEATFTLLKRIMFHQEDPNAARDNPLRSLDQSWRIHHKDEVILVGRVARHDGPAEVVTTGPESPTRLWLGNLPAPDQSRPQMVGTMTQETYVRIILPIAAPDEK
ncbi:MAG TPA: hypothetical protein VK395_31770 [Gemmataceae bacterium]|nr:hypothetical protein [Gemmataceae bacterium]